MTRGMWTTLVRLGFAMVLGAGATACSDDETEAVKKPENRPDKDKISCSCADCWICGDLNRTPTDKSCPAASHVAVGSASGAKTAEPCRLGGCALTDQQKADACKAECVDDSIADCTGPFLVNACEGLGCKGGVAGGYGSNTRSTDSTIAATGGNLATSFDGHGGNSVVSGGAFFVTGCHTPPCEIAIDRAVIDSPGFSITTTVTIPIPIPPFTTDISQTNTLSNVHATNDGRMRATLAANGQYLLNPADALFNASFLVDGKSGATTVEPVGATGGTYNPFTNVFTLVGRWRGQPGSHYDGMTIDMNVSGVFVNRAPVADAGPDQTRECTGNQAAPATLNAAGSFDLDSNLLSFIWSVDGVNRARTPLANLSFALGTHAVDLRTIDSNGALDADSMAVRVVDTTAPRFTFVPAAVVIRDCRTTLPDIGRALGTDICSPVTITNDAPRVFPPGDTMVTWTVQDTSGNRATATQLVSVEFKDDAACCPPGTNVFIGTPSNDSFAGTAGVDCVVGRGAQDVLSGGGGVDYISGGDGDDILSGGAGDDRIFGGSGQDRISGGDGDDQLNGGDGDDTVDGEAGNDRLTGGQGQDHLNGGDGNDNLVGSDGDDTLDGGPGDDTLDGSGLHDRCIGGGGTNVFLMCEQRL